MIRETPDGKTIVMYDRGYPLGFVGSKERAGSAAGIPYLHNHLRFVIKFHKDEAYEGSRLVGFEVRPQPRPQPLRRRHAAFADGSAFLLS
jgi:transmembrane 9 superfamily protein 2/4